MKGLIPIIAFLLFASPVWAEPFTEPVAISVGPTAEEIKIADKQFGKEGYAHWVDHGTYYSYRIEKEIEKLGIPIVDSQELEFEFSVNGVIHPWSLKNREYQWSIIMFNGVDPPREYFFVYDPNMQSYFEKATK
ncbi:MAG: hypothetical protein O6857_06360 [Nitrospinae bacterium]|nr:hypothetical protein [Nitrospinota bacterium]